MTRPSRPGSDTQAKRTVNLESKPLAARRSSSRQQKQSVISVIPPVILAGNFLIASHLLYYDMPAGQGEELGEFFAALNFVFYLVLEWLKTQGGSAAAGGATQLG